MNFNIELTEFPSALHSHIYTYGRKIMPLSCTLDAVLDTSLRESCKSLHVFATEMLSDMYDNPQAYHLPLMELEDFCDGKMLRDAARQNPTKIKKIISELTQAVPKYFDLIRRIADNGRRESDSWVVSPDELQQIAKRVKSLNKRLDSLRRIGLIMETTSEGETCFISTKYPKMFPALNALPFDNLCMLDFRNINHPTKLTHDDFFYPLIDNERELAYMLHEYAMKYKMRTEFSANWMVNYKYKGSPVMSIGMQHDFNCFLWVNVVGKDRTNDTSVIDRRLEKESKDFTEEALRHLSGCDANKCVSCSTYSSGNFVTVMGKKHQMCGEGVIKYDWRKPVAGDIAMIKRLMDIRCEVIDEIQADKKTKK